MLKLCIQADLDHDLSRLAMGNVRLPSISHPTSIFPLAGSIAERIRT